MTTWWRWNRTHLWPAVLGLLLIATLVAAACGGGGDNGDIAESGDAPQAAPADDADRRDREERVEPRTPGQLRIARGEPITLDPAITTDATSASYVVELFGGLVTLSRDLVVVPDLAEALPVPVINPDGSATYRFVIRRDALFHNGARVTADDVKRSIERHAAPGTFSPTAIDYLGDIVGARDYIRGRADAIQGIRVIDERTVEITIDAPKEYFLAKLTYPTAFIVDVDQIEADPRNWARSPTGTGPFTLQEWDLGNQIILKPFDRYHLGAANLDSVRIRFAGGGLTQYENDEVDIADVGFTDIERVRDPSSALNAEFISRNELSVFYVGFNVDQPPFDDPLVRLAFAASVDKTELQEVVLQNLATAAHGILPPGMPGFDENVQGPFYDPERAQELLAESRYAGRLPAIRLTVPGAGATPGPVTEAIIERWRRDLGVEVQIQQVETANFYSDLDAGLYQLFSIGWILDYPDPENVLDLLFHSRSRQNNTGFNSPQVDALLEEARVEQHSAARDALYQRAEQMILDDAPWIPLFFGQVNQVVKPYVEGYVPVASVVPFLRFLTVNQ